MGMFKTALANYKDDTILATLNEDYETMNARRKSYNTFDFAPRDGYALDHVEWRHKTFFDFLDSEVTKLLQVWNDPNVTVAIFGDPDLIRKITPKDYTYQDDYVEEDDAGLEKFAERISAQDGAPVMFKGITQDKKYYVLQAQDFQIRFYDIETEECVKKTYATDGTIWSVSYNEKYDCYFLDLYNWNENEVILWIRN